MSRPTETPRWATTGTRTAPSAAKRLAGWLFGDAIPFDWLNWLLGLAGDWLHWLTRPQQMSHPIPASPARWELDGTSFGVFGPAFAGKQGIGLPSTDPGTGTEFARSYLDISRKTAFFAPVGEEDATHLIVGFACAVFIDSPSANDGELQISITEQSPDPLEPDDVIWSSPTYDTQDPAWQPLVFPISPGIELTRESQYLVTVAFTRSVGSADVAISVPAAIIERPLGG